MEEFNIYDSYLNQVNQDDVYNSNEYKYLKLIKIFIYQKYLCV